jgi:hypothetical protein
MSTEFFGFDVDKAWDYENGFHLTSPINRLGKIIAHFELYKSIVHLAGQVVECGVYKGASLLQFAAFREMLECPDSRRIIGFDMFGAFPRHPGAGADDLTFIQRFEDEGGPGISADELTRVLSHKRLRNIELIAGDVNQTVPQYTEKHPELRIALLHIDVDAYDPTVTILDYFYDRIVPGGLLVLDDYGTVAGETRAVDEFLHSRSAVIRKLPISHCPAYVTK